MAIVKEKLNHEQLKDVQGGAIVETTDAWGDLVYYVYDERKIGGGLCLGQTEDLEHAKEMAHKHGFSDEVMSHEEYRKRYPL